MQRAFLLVAVVAALVPAAAQAGPGGKLAGTVGASWSGEGWTGQLGVALDPGNAARDAAVARIQSAQHYRTGNAFSTEGAHVTGLMSQKVATFPCDEGSSTRTTTFGAVSDGGVPFFIDRPFFDLLRGTGYISVEPVLDNAGDPLPETGRDFFPIPGEVAVNNSFSGCGESFPPTSEDDVAPIFGLGTDAAVPFGFSMFMRSFEIPLRPRNGGWSGSGSAPVDNGSELAITVSYDVKLLGPMKGWLGLCNVPRDKDLAKARSARAALAIMRKAGFPGARYGGRQQTRYHRHGHYYVDEKFTSSGLSECLAGHPKVFLA
jgi:hypothetical protein